MKRNRQTGLASQVFEYADKVRNSAAPLAAVKHKIQQLGEDYADAVDQCEQIDKAFEDLSDLMIDLGVLIVRADRAKEPEAQAQAQAQEGMDREPGGVQPPEQQEYPSGATPGGDRPAQQGETPNSTARRKAT